MFFIIDDSYYLTYRDDKKEIVVSWLVKPCDDKHEEFYQDLYISYMNEDEKVPLKDFLAVVPRTNYKLFGNFLLCDEIGSGLKKEQRAYKGDDSTIAAQFRYWLNMEEIKPFNYIVDEPVKSPAINLAQVEEIIPAHTNVRFVFDDGSVRVLKQILADKSAT